MYPVTKGRQRVTDLGLTWATSWPALGLFAQLCEEEGSISGQAPKYLEMFMFDCLKNMQNNAVMLQRSNHEFHETCHSVTFIVLVNSHQR